MLLRLKSYTSEIYQSFLEWERKVEGFEKITEAKRIRVAIASLAQTILFFNQFQPDQTLQEWLDYNPYLYKVKLLRALTQLEDCACWAISSLTLDDSKFLVEQVIIDALRIPPNTEDEETSLGRSFSRTCNLLHEICPYNTRLLTALERLYQSYELSKICMEEARDVSAVSRLEYLRSLTRY